MINVNLKSNLLFYYLEEAVTVILKLALPMAIGSVCVLLAVWGIAISRKRRAALIYNPSSTSSSVVSLGRYRSSIGVTRGTSKNTKVVLYLCGIYFLLCLPSVIEYVLINTGSISCTMNFVVLLANDLLIPISHSSLFTRIFDGLIFMVIPEFRTAILNILLCKFYTKVS